MTAPLPLLLDPAPDEAWHSYLTRRAAQHRCTVTELADAIGLRHAGRWPPYHGLTLAPQVVERVAPRLSLAPAQVEAMQVARYDQTALDLAGLLENPGLNASRQVTARHWTWLAGSTYCPTCLAQDGIWRTTWRLPWITTCLHHSVALRGTCPRCGTVPGLSNDLHASAPHRVFAAPDGRRCTRPDGPDVCGADLTDQPAAPAAQARLDRTRLLAETIDTGHGTVLGARRTSRQTLTAWQSAIGLAMHLHVVDPTDVGGWGRNNRQLNPPRDPDHVDFLLAAVQPLVTAPAPEAGADVLQQWCDAAGIRSPHADLFTRTTRPSAALQPAIDALLARHGRAHARLQRRLTTTAGQPLVDLGYTPADVPQLAWPCTLPPRWRDSTLPDQLILRAVVSMLLVRAVDGGDWVAAGAALGIPPDKARNWTRYAFSARFGTLRQDLVDTALRAGAALPSAPRSGRWRRRPDIHGYGTTSLTSAQQPPCYLDDPTGWCPEHGGA